MDVSKERLRILEMIQEGRISAEEGARLLEALKGAPAEEPRREKPRQLHIRVTDLTTGQYKVQLHMPWSLVRVGVNMGARFAREKINFKDFIAAVESSADDKVIDIVDKEDNERVEIFVE